MISKVRFWAPLTAILVALAGCGGGGSSSTVVADPVVVQTGYLIEATVQGLTVKSGAQVSVTGADGSFTYEEDAPTSFYLGGIALGTSNVGSVVTLNDVAGAPDSARAVNVLRFLQTLDEDGNADNGITIPATVQTAAASMTLDFDQDPVAFENDSRTQYAMSVLGSHLTPSRSQLLAVGSVAPVTTARPQVAWTAATNTRGWNGKIRVEVPGAAQVELLSLRYVLVGGRSEQCMVIVNNTMNVNVLVGRTVTVGSSSYRIERPGIAANSQVRYQGPANTACSFPRLAAGGTYSVSIL